MKYSKLTYGDAFVSVAEIRPEGGVAEYHVMVTCENAALDFNRQLEVVSTVYRNVAENLAPAVAVTGRCFVSDPANQAAAVASELGMMSVGQAPLSQAKIAVWAYFAEGFAVETRTPQLTVCTHGDYKHVYTEMDTTGYNDSHVQALMLFDALNTSLEAEGGNPADNCMRTWIYVRDIDRNYSGMVGARNTVFATYGLSQDTHFIASTGIGAEMASPGTIVMMMGYSLIGHKPEQVKYISAPDFLNRTIEYGVAFERATAIDFGDRRQVFVSGTASIDSKGEIIHPGDVMAQGRRAVKNVEALLREAECGLEDIASAIVYLRDPADYERIKPLMAELLPDVPKVIVHGPVCRPGWLFEIECIAIKSVDNKGIGRL